MGNSTNDILINFIAGGNAEDVPGGSSSGLWTSVSTGDTLMTIFAGLLLLLAVFFLGFLLFKKLLKRSSILNCQNADSSNSADRFVRKDGYNSANIISGSKPQRALRLLAIFFIVIALTFAALFANQSIASASEKQNSQTTSAAQNGLLNTNEKGINISFPAGLTGHVDQNGTTVVDKGTITNNSTDYVSVQSITLKETEASTNATWTFTVTNNDGTTQTIFSGKAGQKTPIDNLTFQAGESKELSVSTDINPQTALSLINHNVLKASFYSLLHPHPVHFNTQQGISIVDKNGQDIDNPSYVGEGDDFTFFIKKDRQNNIIVMVDDIEISPNDDGSYTIDSETIKQDPVIFVYYTYSVFVNIGDGASLKYGSFPAGWTAFEQSSTIFSASCKQGTTSEEIQQIWRQGQTPLQKAGFARTGWTSNIGEEGVQEDGGTCEILWTDSSHNFNPSHIDDGIKIVDNDDPSYVYSDKDYPIPVADYPGSFSFKVNTDQPGVEVVAVLTGPGEGDAETLVQVDDDGTYTIEAKDIEKDRNIEIRYYYQTIVDLGQGNIKEKSYAPSGWKLVEGTSNYYKKYPSNTMAQVIQAEWDKTNVKVVRNGFARIGWTSEIPDVGLNKNNLKSTISWGTATNSFDPEVIDNGIVIKDEEGNTLSDDDFPIPVLDDPGTITIIVSDDSDAETVVAVKDKDGNIEIIEIGEDGKVTLDSDDLDKDKEISIRHIFSVNVDLDGGEIKAGTNPPKGWNSTSKTQYTKKFVSGTSAEEIESQWNQKDAKVIKNKFARNGWTSNINALGVSSQGCYCSISWTPAQNSFNPDLGDNIVIQDPDTGYIYDEYDFPIPVPDNPGDFRFKIIEPKDSEYIVEKTDEKGTTNEIVPNEDNEYVISKNDLNKDNEYSINVVYEVIAKLGDTGIIGTNAKNPVGWEADTTQHLYKHKFKQNTSFSDIVKTWEETEVINTDTVKPQAFKEWTADESWTQLKSDSEMSVTWADAYTITVSTEDENILIKDKTGTKTLSFPINVIQGSKFDFKISSTVGTANLAASVDGTIITPSEDVYSFTPTANCTLKIESTYAVSVDLGKGSIAEKDKPAGWTLYKDTETQTNYAVKNYTNGTTSESIISEWENVADKMTPPEGATKCIGFEADIEQVEGSMQIVAQWNVATFTVTFVSDDTTKGTVEKSQMLEVPYGTVPEYDSTSGDIMLGEERNTVSPVSNYEYKNSFVEWKVVSTFTSDDDSNINIANSDDDENYNTENKTVKLDAIKKATTLKAVFSTESSKTQYQVTVDIKDGTIDASTPAPTDWTHPEGTTTYSKNFDYGTDIATITGSTGVWGQINVTKTGHSNASWDITSGVVGADGKNVSITAQYTRNTIEINFSNAESGKEFGNLDFVGKLSVKYGDIYTITNTKNANGKITQSTITFVDADTENSIADINAIAATSEDEYTSYYFKEWSGPSTQEGEGTVTENANFISTFIEVPTLYTVTINFNEYKTIEGLDDQGWTHVDSDDGEETHTWKKDFRRNTTKSDIENEFVWQDPEDDEKAHSITIGYDVDKRKIRGIEIESGKYSASKLVENINYSMQWTNAFHDVDVSKSAEIETLKDENGKEIETGTKIKDGSSIAIAVEVKEGASGEVSVFIDGKEVKKNENGYYVTDPVHGDVKVVVSFAYRFTVDLNGGQILSDPPENWKLLDETKKSNDDTPTFQAFDDQNLQSLSAPTNDSIKYYRKYPADTTPIATIIADWADIEVSKKDDPKPAKFVEWKLEDETEMLVTANSMQAQWKNAKNVAINADDGAVIKDENKENKLQSPVLVADDESLKFTVDADSDAIIDVRYGTSVETGNVLTPDDDGVYTIDYSDLDNSKTVFVRLFYRVKFVMKNAKSFKAPDGWTEGSETESEVVTKFYTKDILKGSAISDILDEWKNASLTRDGYTFSTWVSSDENQSLNGTLSSKLIIYPSYDVHTYQVSFDPNSTTATGSIDPQTFNYNETKELTKNEYQSGKFNITCPGFTFDGWTNKDKTTTYTDGQSVSDLVDVTTAETGSITLYAKWIENSYKVIFNANDGSETPETTSQDFKYTDNKALAANEFERTGYTFLGWATSASATTAQYSDGAQVSKLSSVNDDKVNLYAVWSENSYTVTFAGNGNTSGEMSAQSFTYTDSKAITTNAFTRTGYAFDGWKGSDGKDYSDGQTVSGLCTEDNGNFVLTAVWVAEEYTITFNANDGSETPTTTTQSMTFDRAAKLDKNTFTRDYFTFQGWATSSTGTKVYSDEQEVTNIWTGEGSKQIILYAVWVGNTYTISFDANTGQGSVDSISVQYGDTTEKTIPDPTGETPLMKKTGHMFNNWNTQADGKGDIVKPGDKVSNITADMTLYAQWDPITYTVVFHNNLKAEETAAQTLTYNSEEALNCPKTWSRVASTQLGWNTDPKATSISYQTTGKAKNLADDQDDVVDLYAIWQYNKFSITFDSNGGTGTVPTINDVTYISTTTVPDKGEMKKTGGTFAGWNTQADGKGTSYTADDKITNLENNLTLYAQWTLNQYTLKFYDESGKATGTMKDQKITYGVETALSPNLFVRKGYTFKGWTKTSKSTTVNYYDKQKVTITDGDEDLYAVWQPNNYTIRFDANGGSGSIADISATCNDDSTYTGVEIPTDTYSRTGYNFVNWNTKKDGKGDAKKAGDYINKLTETSGEVVTLYAQWQAIDYKININPNYGEASTVPVTVHYGEEYDLTDKVTRKGYTWLSYVTDPSKAETVYPIKGTYDVADDTTIYATWSVNYYDVNFASNDEALGKTTIATQNLAYDTNYSISDNTITLSPSTGNIIVAANTKVSPTGRVYSFDHWEIDDKAVAGTGKTGLDTTFTAIFKDTPMKYTATVEAGDGESITKIPSGWTEVTASKKYTKQFDHGTSYADIIKSNEWEVTKDTSKTSELLPSVGSLTQDTTFTPNFSLVTRSVDFSTFVDTMLIDSEQEFTANASKTTINDSYTWSIDTDHSSYASITPEIENPNVATLKALKSTGTDKVKLTVTLKDNSTENPYLLCSKTVEIIIRNGTITWVDTNISSVTAGGAAITTGTECAPDTVIKVSVKGKTNFNAKYTYQYGDESAVTKDSNQTFTMPKGDVTIASSYSGNKLNPLFWRNWGIKFKDSSMSGHYRTSETCGSISEGKNYKYKYITHDEYFDIADADDSSMFGERKGYDFEGWYNWDIDYKINKDQKVDISKFDGGYNDFYAQWTQHTYTVKFETSGGSAVNDIPCKYGWDNDGNADQHTMPSSTKESYTFKGWATSAERAQEGTVDYEAGKTFGGDKVVVENSTEKHTKTDIGDLTSDDKAVITLYAVWETITYDVIFEPNGATTGTKQSQKFDHGVEQKLKSVESLEFTREGYSFDGWATSETGARVYGDKEAITLTSEGKTLYAHWVPHSYSIQFNSRNGSAVSNVEKINYDEEVKTPSSERSGYEFMGWADTEAQAKAGTVVHEKGGTLKNLTQDDTAVVTLYAVWKANSYNVEFIVGGTTYGKVANEQDSNFVFPKDNPEKTGHSFDGWYTAATGGTRLYGYLEGETPTVYDYATHGVKVYAQFSAITYTVSFDSKGGSSVDAMSCTYNQTYNVPSSTRDGYTFKGWAKQSTTTVELEPDGTFNNLADTQDANVVYDAIWGANTNTVTFDLNYTDAPTSPTKNLTEDQKFELPATPSREGYSFDGWFTASTGGSQVDATTTYKKSTYGDKVYAHWTAKSFSVSYLSGEGSGTSMAVQNVVYDTTGNKVKNCTYTKTGHTFSGWKDADGNIYNVGDSLDNIIKDFNLTAQWEALELKITYKDKGGSDFSGTHESGHPTSHSYGSSTTLKSASKTNYVFEGWFTESDCSGTAVTSLGATSYTNNITLYAKWSGVNKTVSFNANTGSGSIDSLTVEYGTDGVSIPSPSTNIYKTGSTFKEWNTAANGSGEKYDEGRVVKNITKDITLYAIWTANTYDVKFNYNYSGAPSAITKAQTHNSKYDIPDEPTRANYKFAGWYTTSSNTGGTKITSDSVFNCTSYKETIYARWTAKTSRDFDNNLDGLELNDDGELEVQYGKTVNLNYKGEGAITWNLAQKGVGRVTTAISDSNKKVSITGTTVGEGITLTATIPETADYASVNFEIKIKVIPTEYDVSGIVSSITLTPENTSANKVSQEFAIAGGVPSGITFTGYDGTKIAVDYTSGSANFSIYRQANVSGGVTYITVTIPASGNYAKMIKTIKVVLTSNADLTFTNSNVVVKADKSTTGSNGWTYTGDAGADKCSVTYSDNGGARSATSSLISATVSTSSKSITNIKATGSGTGYTIVYVKYEATDNYSAVEKSFKVTVTDGTRSISAITDLAGNSLSTLYLQPDSDQKLTINLTASEVGANDEYSVSASGTSASATNSDGKKSTSSFVITPQKPGDTTFTFTLTDKNKIYASCTTTFTVHVAEWTFDAQKAGSASDADNTAVATAYKNGKQDSATLGNTVKLSSVNANNSKKIDTLEYYITAVGDKSNSTSASAVFDSNNYAKSLALSGSKIQTIYANAFKGSENLEAISIASAVTTINASAFENCTSLVYFGSTTSFDFSANVKTIGKAAFKGCNSLKLNKNTFSKASSLTEISEELFMNCRSNGLVHIPESVTKIGKSAFEGNSSLKYVVSSFADGKGKTIGSYAFKGCKNLLNFVERSDKSTEQIKAETNATGIFDDVTKQSDRYKESAKCIAELIYSSYANSTEMGNLLRNTYGATYYKYTEVSNASTLKTVSSSGAYYYLTGNLNSNNYALTFSADNVIDLNGYIISRGLSSSTASGYVMNVSAAKFRIDDSSSLDNDKMGKITGGYNSSDKGGGIYSNSTTFNLVNGNIYNNKVDNKSGYGGGICFEGSLLNIFGGVISNNSVNAHNEHGGGGVALLKESTSTLYFYGGLIKSNSVSNASGKLTEKKHADGGGILACDKTYIYMYGGEISYNKTDTSNENSDGGGIYLCGNGVATKTSDLHLEGGLIDYNTSGGGGGGIQLRNGTIWIGSMDAPYTGDAVIGTHNYSAKADEGHCIYAFDGTVYMNSGTVGGDGRGIFRRKVGIYYADLEIRGGSIYKEN